MEIVDYELAHFFRQKGLQLDLNSSALSKVLARYELYKRIQNIPGDIVECGVYRGAALFQWANFVDIFSPKSQRKIIGFDTFDGFTEHGEIERDNRSIEEISENVHPRSKDHILEIARELGVSDRIELVPGDATQTIAEYVQENRSLRIALLHLDFDTFEPTKAALGALFDHLVLGGIIIFDQYGDMAWGETQGVDAFFEDRSLAKKFHAISWSSAPGAYYVKKN